MAEDDEYSILKQIRARAVKQDEADASPTAKTYTEADKEALLAEIRARAVVDEDQQIQASGSTGHTARRVEPLTFDELSQQLRERIRKQQAARRERDLTQEDLRRLTALEDILNQLQQGKHIQNRRLKTWLTDDEYSFLTDEWQSQQALREELQEKPDVIVDYEQRLRKATLLYNRAKGYRRKGNREQLKRFEQEYTSELEDLIECYAEIIAEDYSMTQWFDRDLDFDAGGDSTADLASIPRVITSKSAQAHGTGGMLSRKQSKRDLKIAVVEHAINQLRRKS